MRPGRVGAGKDARAKQDPADDQREQVDGVHDDEERDHPRRGLLARHARLAKRPVGEEDAAGAAGREQARRREARHVDLVALVPGQAQDVAADDPLEHGDLRQEHDDAERHRDADPDRLAVVELREAVLDADDRREEEVDRRDEDDDRADRDREALRVLEEPRLFVGVVLGSPATGSSREVEPSPPSASVRSDIPGLMFAGTVAARTLGLLSVRDLLQALEPGAHLVHHRLGERVAEPHGRDERGAGDEVGHVVLAQVDEREAEDRRVGAADRAGLGPGLAQEQSAP